MKDIALMSYTHGGHAIRHKFGDSGATNSASSDSPAILATMF